MHHQLELGLVHFFGLRRMVEFRGGLTKLMKENRCLAQKPWRLALEFSLQDGSRLIYSLRDVPVELALDKPLALLTCSPSGLSPPLLNLLLDITHIMQTLNSTSVTDKAEPMDYSDAVFLRLHRLLHFAP
jgi:hypothetical protein